MQVNSVRARIRVVKRRVGDGDDRGSPGVCNASMFGAATLGDCGRGCFHKMYCEQLLLCWGENCSIDVCWEGKKLRVICTHLNLGSVMHMYARDLEDLRIASHVTGGRDLLRPSPT